MWVIPSTSIQAGLNTALFSKLNLVGFKMMPSSRIFNTNNYNPLGLTLAGFVIYYRLSSKQCSQEDFFMVKRVRSNHVSKFFRNTFEHKLARKAISASLTLLVMGFGLLSTLLASETQATEVALISQLGSQQLITQTTLDKPLDGRLAQGFHGWHRGIDILDPVGTPIEPIADGVVSEDSLGRLGWGNTVVIDHGNGLQSRYAHMKEVRVIEGEQLTKDQVLGTVGMTGWTTGPHLHLEIYQNGRAIDPATIFPPFASPDYAIAQGK